MTTRQAFEAQIRKQFPTVLDDMLLGRSLNGRYGSMVTEHAWLAWQAAKATCPAWHSTPTCAGVWLCDEGDICYTWTAHNIEILDRFDPGDGLRWYGPIPEDRQ